MQDVDGGAGIVQRAVIRGCRSAEQPCQRAELAVGRLVLADQLSGQVGCVDDAEGRPAVTGERGGGLEERDVEGRVVGDQHAVAGELEKGRKHAVDPGRVGHHLVGDAGQDRDECGDRLSRVDQGLELADHLAAPDLDRSDLGDVCPRRAAAGRLEVDDDEGDLGQGGAELVECALDALHGDDVRCCR